MNTPQLFIKISSLGIKNRLVELGLFSPADRLTSVRPAEGMCDRAGWQHWKFYRKKGGIIWKGRQKLLFQPSPHRRIFFLCPSSTAIQNTYDTQKHIGVPNELRAGLRRPMDCDILRVTCANRRLFSFFFFCIPHTYTYVQRPMPLIGQRATVATKPTSDGRDKAAQGRDASIVHVR